MQEIKSNGNDLILKRIVEKQEEDRNLGFGQLQTAKMPKSSN